MWVKGHTFELVTVPMREWWNAYYPKGEPYVRGSRRQYVFCEETNYGSATSKSSFVEDMRILQTRESSGKGNWCIKYNHIICRDGTIAEGRGWDVKPKLPGRYQRLNHNSLYIGLHGKFNKQPPSAPMLDSLNKIIRYGMDVKKIERRILLFCI